MKAIVLSRRPHREFDEIISLYTYDRGRVEVLARGNKKINSKQSPFLEPFSLIECALIPGREIDHLAKTQPVEYFAPIREHEHKSRAAAWAMAITRTLTPEEVPDHRIFFTLKNWLEFLAQDSGSHPLVLDSFILTLLGWLGLAPQLSACVLCGKELAEISRALVADKNLALPGLDNAGGGLVCGQCRLTIEPKIRPINLAEISGLQILLSGDWRTVSDFASTTSEIEAKNLHRLTYEFSCFHVELPLRDWSF